MKAVIVHNIASTMLHRQVFLLAMHSPSASPGARARFEQIAERYDRIAQAITSNDEPGIAYDDMTNQSDLPALDDMGKLVDWSDYAAEGRMTWQLVLLDSQLKPITGSGFSAETVWQFHQLLARRYPDAPHGLIAWAVYAHKGDTAAFYDAASKIVYQLDLK